MIPPSSIDLTTVGAVKSWLSGSGIAPVNTSDDDAIQACVTYFSNVFLWRTSMTNQDGTMPDENPFLQVVTYTETYDGPGGPRLFLNHRPIQDVQSLMISGQTIMASTGWGQTGYVIDGNKASITLRGCGWFYMDTQNINVVYDAGYPDLPSDIVLAATKSCALQYKRKDWIGLHSKSLAQGAGTTSYEAWELDPDVERLISNYTRWAV